jgi:hypothetical protein
MDDSDGFLKFSNKIHKTKILPLRWIGNLCSEIAGNSIVKAFDLQDQENFGCRFKFHSKVWHYFNKPYTWWGTYYVIDTDAWKIDPDTQDLLGRLGSDYDEDGIPYWDK